MKRRLLTTTLVTSALLVLPTACGPVTTSSSNQTSGSIPTNSTGNNTAINATNTGNGTGNNANNTATGQTTQSAIQLQPFSDSQTGISVQVPAGWTQSTITGGDYTGWQFVNPQDSSQVVKIIRSSCVGCAESNGQPDPKQPIPETNATNVKLSSDGLTATYDFVASGNPNPGMGSLTVTNNSSGYGYVEVLLPSSDASIASEILKSFSIKS